MAATRSRLREHVIHQHLKATPLVPEGKLGKVYKVTGLNEEDFALKISEYGGATQKEESYLLDEVENLSKLKHPNVLKFIDGWEIRSENGQLRMHLLTEFCTCRDLRTYLNTELGHPPCEETFACWLAQITSGLEYIHACNILHRNLKTSNIMVKRDDGDVTMKIGDFGMSKVLDQPDAMANSQVGTPYFMSPEILKCRPYNHKTDIWSLGCTAYEMATLTIIFQAQSITTLMSRVDKNRAAELTKEIKYSSFFKDLLCRLLDQNPDRRPTAGEIIHILSSRPYDTSPPVSMVVREDVSNPHWDDRRSRRRSRTSLPEVAPEFTNNNQGAGADMTEALSKFSRFMDKARLSKTGPQALDIHVDEETRRIDQRIVMQIKSQQSSLVKDIGMEIFIAAFSTLSTRDPVELEQNLRNALGQYYDHFGQRFVALQLLEARCFEESEEDERGASINLNKTT